MRKDWIYNFEPEKNKKLMALRNISFEEIIAILETVGLLDVIKNPNTAKYRDQKIYMIEIEGYVYAVPFVEKGDQIFLKTAFPSRKATAKYLKRRGES